MRALACFAIAAQEGRLHEEALWIMDSQLVYLAKKNSGVPRPVRIGEVLRRTIGKANCKRNAPTIRQSLVQRRQLGVATPGACEGLVHEARAVEHLLRTEAHGEWAVCDLDLVNCFCHFEWPATRASAEALAPTMAKWLRWSTQRAVRVRLPSGEWRCVDRGAEQGDPEGSFKASSVLADACSRAARKLRE